MEDRHSNTYFSFTTSHSEGKQNERTRRHEQFGPKGMGNDKCG